MTIQDSAAELLRDARRVVVFRAPLVFRAVLLRALLPAPVARLRAPLVVLLALLRAPLARRVAVLAALLAVLFALRAVPPLVAALARLVAALPAFAAALPVDFAAEPADLTAERAEPARADLTADFAERLAWPTLLVADLRLRVAAAFFAAADRCALVCAMSSSSFAIGVVLRLRQRRRLG